MKKLLVSLTPQAVADLDDILDFIRARSPMNTLRFIDKLRAAIFELTDYGASLPLAPEASAFKFKLQQLVVKPCRVLFRVEDDGIEILHVRHGARLPAKADQRGNPF